MGVPGIRGPSGLGEARSQGRSPAKAGFARSLCENKAMLTCAIFPPLRVSQGEGCVPGLAWVVKGA